MKARATAPQSLGDLAAKLVAKIARKRAKATRAQTKKPPAAARPDLETATGGQTHE